MEELLEILEQEYKSTNVYRVRNEPSELDVAYLAFHQADFVRARLLFAEILRHKGGAEESADISVALVAAWLACTLLKLDQYDDAHRLLVTIYESYDARQISHGADRRSDVEFIQTALYALGYLDLQKATTSDGVVDHDYLQQALRWLEKNLEIREYWLGPSDDQTIATRFRLGSAYYLNQQHIETNLHLSQILGSPRRSQHIRGDLRYSCRMWLGCNYYMLNDYHNAEICLKNVPANYNELVFNHQEKMAWLRVTWYAATLYKLKKYHAAEREYCDALQQLLKNGAVFKISREGFPLVTPITKHIITYLANSIQKQAGFQIANHSKFLDSIDTDTSHLPPEIGALLQNLYATAVFEAMLASALEAFTRKDFQIALDISQHTLSWHSDRCKSGDPDSSPVSALIRSIIPSLPQLPSTTVCTSTDIGLFAQTDNSENRTHQHNDEDDESIDADMADTDRVNGSRRYAVLFDRAFSRFGWSRKPRRHDAIAWSPRPSPSEIYYKDEQAQPTMIGGSHLPVELPAFGSVRPEGGRDWSHLIESPSSTGKEKYLSAQRPFCIAEPPPRYSTVPYSLASLSSVLVELPANEVTKERPKALLSTSMAEGNAAETGSPLHSPARQRSLDLSSERVDYGVNAPRTSATPDSTSVEAWPLLQRQLTSSSCGAESFKSANSFVPARSTGMLEDNPTTNQDPPPQTPQVGQAPSSLVRSPSHEESEPTIMSQPIFSATDSSTHDLSILPASAHKSPGTSITSGNSDTTSLDSFFERRSRGADPLLDDVFTETEILALKRLLEVYHIAWSTIPRTYIVLRTIQCLEEIDNIIKTGFSDYELPVSRRNVPACLDAEKRTDFLAAQKLVLSREVNLEQRGISTHHHFAKGDPSPFEKLQRIGGGGFGEVDLVRSKKTLAHFAQKRVLRQDFSTGHGIAGMRSIIAEIEILKGLHHRHIVRYVGSYTDHDCLALIMEPVADSDLFVYLLQIQPKQYALLRSFFGCLATGLEFLHGKKIRHKDVKPQNILVHGQTVLLTDFGLARDFRDGTVSTTVGMPNGASARYCAPEVAMSQSRNYKSDIWSLGIVFLEMLVALKGKDYEWTNKFMLSHGTRESFVRTNLDGTEDLIKELEKTGLGLDNVVLDWIRPMTEAQAAKRPTAGTLLQRILDPDSSNGKYCGLCCRGTNEPSSEED